MTKSSHVDTDWHPTDRQWLKQRKAFWKHVKPYFRARHPPPGYLAELEQYCYSGAGGDALNLGDVLLLHPSADPLRLRELALTRVGDWDPQVVLSQTACYVMQGLEFDLIEFQRADQNGVLFGRERLVVQALMPARYTPDMYLKDERDYLRPVFGMRPDQFHFEFVKHCLQFLESPYHNPHSPWQDLWPQWLELLAQPEFAQRDWREPVGNEALHALMRLAHHYCDPDLVAAHAENARALARHLATGLENARLPTSMRVVWEWITRGDGGCAPLSGDPGRDFLALKTLHGVEPAPALVATMVEAYRDLGLTDEAYDPTRWEATDLGPELTLGFARLLGHGLDDPRWDSEDEAQRLVSGCRVPAQVYRLRTNGRFTGLGDAPGSAITLVLAVLERAPGLIADEDSPWLLLYAEYGPAYDRHYAHNAAVCQERHARTLFEQRTGQRWVGWFLRGGEKSRSAIRRDLHGLWMYDPWKYSDGDGFQPLWIGRYYTPDPEEIACPHQRACQYSPRF